MEALLPLYFHNLVAMAQLRKCGIRVSARVIRRLIDDRRQPDLRQQLGKLSVPTLLIAGRHDQRTPPEYAREIAERVYYSRLVVLDGSGHFPFLEQPSEFLGLLREQVAGAH